MALMAKDDGVLRSVAEDRLHPAFELLGGQPTSLGPTGRDGLALPFDSTAPPRVASIGEVLVGPNLITVSGEQPTSSEHMLMIDVVADAQGYVDRTGFPGCPLRSSRCRTGN